MSQAALHFDFITSATRKTIFSQAITQVTDEVNRGLVGMVTGDMSIPMSAHLNTYDEVCTAIDTTVAKDSVKQQGKDIYRILAEAEAQVHGCPFEEVHFHEVGLGSTCREILGICTCIDILAPSSITATAVQVGKGTVECAHGTLDIPAPATAAILEKYSIPLTRRRLEGELCTPTSAALIAYFVKEFV